MTLVKYYYVKYYQKELNIISTDEWINFCKNLTFILMKRNKNILINLKNI